MLTLMVVLAGTATDVAEPHVQVPEGADLYVTHKAQLVSLSKLMSVSGAGSKLVQFPKATGNKVRQASRSMVSRLRTRTVDGVFMTYLVWLAKAMQLFAGIVCWKRVPSLNIVLRGKRLDLWLPALGPTSLGNFLVIPNHASMISPHLSNTRNENENRTR